MKWTDIALIMIFKEKWFVFIDIDKNETWKRAEEEDIDNKS